MTNTTTATQSTSLKATLILGTADIEASITNVSIKGKALDRLIQLSACSVINHFELHGDYTLMNSLVKAMPKGSRVNALLGFFEEFGGVAFDTETKALVKDKTKGTDVEGALASNWTKFKPEPAYNGLDLDKMLKVLVKKAVTASNETDPVKASKNLINNKQLIALAEVAGVKLEEVA